MDNNLYHFGIKGMRWGHRKAKLSKSSKKSKLITSEDYKQSRDWIKKGYKALSTKELQLLTNRLHLERQYKDLNPTSYKKGLNFVKSVTAAGTTIASLYALSRTPLFQDIAKAIGKR